jgi:AmiR/NasT family two-component response regulator
VVIAIDKRVTPHTLRRRFINAAEHDRFHQATGMVMAQMGIDAGSATDVLRAHAWSYDRLLMDTASEVVARTLTFSPT